MTALRDTILAAADTESEVVDVPEWGVKLEMRSPSARERTRMLKAAMIEGETTPDLEKFGPALIVATAFDPDTGEQVFTVDDIVALGDKSAQVVERLSTVSMRLAGMRADAVDEGKDDSSTTPNDATSSA